MLAVRTDQMLKTLKHARLDNSYEAELRKLLAVDLLILDDFALDAMDAVESRDVYEILLERYRTGSMIVTSNRGPDEWLATFADPVRAQSAIDRFTSNAYDLVIEGESYRPAAQAAARQGRQGALAMSATPATAHEGALGGSHRQHRRSFDRRRAPAGSLSTSRGGESVDRIV